MSAGVVTFVYLSGGFVRIPREELRAAKPKTVHINGRARVNVEVSVTSIHQVLVIAIGMANDHGVGRERAMNMDGVEAILIVAREMITDLRSSVDTDITWTEGTSRTWSREIGRPS